MQDSVLETLLIVDSTTGSKVEICCKLEELKCNFSNNSGVIFVTQFAIHICSKIDFKPSTQLKLHLQSNLQISLQLRKSIGDFRFSEEVYLTIQFRFFDQLVLNFD
jgi:hypothetical protein